MPAAITNLRRNIALIAILTVALFYHKDESKIVYNNILDRQEASSEYHKEESLEYRVRLGFSKQGERRLQQSRNDSRQL